MRKGGANIGGTRADVHQVRVAPFPAALGILDRVVKWTVSAIMAVMLGVVFTQVILRYFLNDSIMWADEISRLCFVWTIFLAMPLGIRASRHVAIDLLVARIPSNLQDVLARAMSGVAALMMAVACYQAARVAIDNWDEMLPTVDITASSFYLAVMIGCGHSLLHLLYGACVGIESVSLPEAN